MQSRYKALLEALSCEEVRLWLRNLYVPPRYARVRTGYGCAQWLSRFGVQGAVSVDETSSTREASIGSLPGRA